MSHITTGPWPEMGPFDEVCRIWITGTNDDLKRQFFVSPMWYRLLFEAKLLQLHSLDAQDAGKAFDYIVASSLIGKCLFDTVIVDGLQVEATGIRKISTSELFLEYLSSGDRTCVVLPPEHTESCGPDVTCFPEPRVFMMIGCKTSKTGFVESQDADANYNSTKVSNLMKTSEENKKAIKALRWGGVRTIVRVHICLPSRQRRLPSSYLNAGTDWKEILIEGDTPYDLDFDFREFVINVDQSNIDQFRLFSPRTIAILKKTFSF